MLRTKLSRVPPKVPCIGRDRVCIDLLGPFRKIAALHVFDHSFPQRRRTVHGAPHRWWPRQCGLGYCPSNEVPHVSGKSCLALTLNQQRARLGREHETRLTPEPARARNLCAERVSSIQCFLNADRFALALTGRRALTVGNLSTSREPAAKKWAAEGKLMIPADLTQLPCA